MDRPVKVERFMAGCQREFEPGLPFIWEDVKATAEYVAFMETLVREMAAVINSDIDVPASLRDPASPKRTEEWQSYKARRDGSHGTKATEKPTPKASSVEKKSQERNSKGVMRHILQRLFPIRGSDG